MIEYIDGLNSREAKILNTYINFRNDLYIDEGLLDVQHFRTQTENLIIDEKYVKACETLYWMSFVIDHKNMFNVKDEIK